MMPPSPGLFKLRLDENNHVAMCYVLQLTRKRADRRRTGAICAGCTDDHEPGALAPFCVFSPFLAGSLPPPLLFLGWPGQNEKPPANPYHELRALLADPVRLHLKDGGRLFLSGGYQDETAYQACGVERASKKGMWRAEGESEAGSRIDESVPLAHNRHEQRHCDRAASACVRWPTGER